jgi:hypothetical protein
MLRTFLVATYTASLILLHTGAQVRATMQQYSNTNRVQAAHPHYVIASLEGLRSTLTSLPSSHNQRLVQALHSTFLRQQKVRSA